MFVLLALTLSEKSVMYVTILLESNMNIEKSTVIVLLIWAGFKVLIKVVQINSRLILHLNWLTFDSEQKLTLLLP